MNIDLLYVDDCPGYQRVLPRLRQLADETGATLSQRRIATAEQAVAERFLGSPTIRVDDRDIDPGAGQRTDYGLKCRLYPTPTRPSPAPPDAWLTDALARAR